MRFDRLSVFLRGAAIAVVVLELTSLPANAEDPASRLQKIAIANSLDLPGKTPFHLKMSFQLYDLSGQPSDLGLLEEWWAAPFQSRVTIRRRIVETKRGGCLR